MNAKVFISSSFDGRDGLGVSRAERGYDGEWQTQVVAERYNVQCLARDPQDSNQVYAGTQESGILRSTDAGASWAVLGLEGLTVKALAVDPQRPRTIYAGMRPAGLTISQDGGDSWHESQGFRRIPGRWWWFSPAERPFSAYVHALSVSPEDPGVILAGMEFGAVVRSEDGGETWSGHRRGALRDCHSMTFHSTNGDWAYEGGAGWKAAGAVSSDGGRTWSQPRDGLDRHYGWSCVADPEQPEIWYVAASTGPGDAHSLDHAEAYIYRSTGDAGWTKLAGGLPDPLDDLPTTLMTDHALRVTFTPDCPMATSGSPPIDGDEWSKLPINLKGIWHQLTML